MDVRGVHFAETPYLVGKLLPPVVKRADVPLALTETEIQVRIPQTAHEFIE